MRILHTADLHLGRQLHGFSLADDHQAVLDQIVAALSDHQPDVFIIAGDVFDRPMPPASAQRQFNAFLNQARRVSQAAIVISAGNHDSADRIEAMAIMADPEKDLIRGALMPQEPALILQDAHGSVAISAVPFAYEHAAKECFNDPEIASPEDVLKAQIASARAQVPDGARWIIVAHGFVAGGQTSDAEKALTRVGGIEYVAANVFDGASYVALGHLHRPQKAGGDHIRYSGAPLALGFDEAGAEKSLALVDLAADGSVDITPIPITPRRQLRKLRGKLAELLAGVPSDDYVHAVLTDDTPQLDPMKRLRDRFPNTCIITYAREEDRAAGTTQADAGQTLLDDPTSLIDAFLSLTRQTAASAAERPLIAQALDRIDTSEDAT
ncbi:exonuclease SbcCD subunit D [Yoonia sp. 208BN28-4]|uniref:exonuclease SbcCD subunit D n=1 Tax=Yoonia sp. 208BN28-4 TaxID=3126505 RepID=UPI0030A3DDE8